MAEKKRIAKFVTPKGIAVYPWLDKPDTKFKADGEYTMKLRLSAEESQDLITKIDEAIAEACAAEKQKNPKKAVKKASPPYSKVVDDEGNETGEYLFKFSLKAKVKTKEGKEWTQRPEIVDAKGNIITGKVKVGGGSEVKVGCQIAPFTAPVGTGVTLRLMAVRVLKLVTYGGDKLAGFDFGDDEGFEYDPSTQHQSEDDVPAGVEGEASGADF